MEKICFVTTGDIKSIATAKRALGLSNPLTDLGWDVSIIMADTKENRHRVEIECDKRVKVYFFSAQSVLEERKEKNELIKLINPDYLYICAFVTRNIVGITHSSKKIVEHSELQSGFVKGIQRFRYLLFEYYSIIYSDGLLNASMFLQKLFQKRAKSLLKKEMPQMYFPYAFNPSVMKLLNIDYNNLKFKRFRGKVNFVFLGSVTRNYGIFTILEAVKQLRIKYSNFQMLILGKGADFEEAKQKIHDEGLENVVFMPGYVEEEEISEYFSLASAFISPMNDSIQDWARCPSKMYLYLPYKKPVITCKIGEPYEVLKGKGLYYKTGDSEQMAVQMQLVLTGKEQQVDVNAEEHSWRVRAKQLDNWIRVKFK